jgi:cytochrome c553
LHAYAGLTKGVDIIARIHIDSLDCLFKMNAKLSFVLAFAAACVTTATVAQELKGDAQAGSKKIAMCIGCHGIKGYQASFPEVYKVPMISGQGAKYIASSLNAYKAGERKHPTMKGIAQSLSDQDIVDISAYYEQHGTAVAVPDKAVEGTGKGAALLAKGACASCHGPNLNKPIDPSYPKIAGQHKDYLYVALKSYKTEGQATWGRSNGVMGGIAKQFTNAELKELAQYISAQPGELRVVPQSKFR